jgi:hypothetical protein
VCCHVSRYLFSKAISVEIIDSVLWSLGCSADVADGADGADGASLLSCVGGVALRLADTQLKETQQNNLSVRFPFSGLIQK